MRRIAVLTITILLVVGALVAVDHTAAQDDATAGQHPVVGSWVITFPDNPVTPPSLYTFGGDGTVVGSSFAGPRHGAWGAVDDGAADLTVVGLAGGEEIGVLGLLRIRGRVEVDDAGDRFDLTYEVQGITPDGTVVDTDGPFRAEGIRVAVQTAAFLATPTADGTPATDGTPTADGATTDASPTPEIEEVIATALASAIPDVEPPDADGTPGAAP